MSSEFVSCDAGDSEHHACLVILPGYSEKRDSGAGKKEGSPGSSIICFQVEVVTPNRTQPDWLVLSPKAGPQFWFAVKPRELTSSWRRRDQPGGMAHQRRHGRRGHTGVRADRPADTAQPRPAARCRRQRDRGRGLNAANLLASLPARLYVASQLVAPPGAPTQPPLGDQPPVRPGRGCFVLVAGVNDYADPRIQLSYAASDAKDVARAFRGQRQDRPASCRTTSRRWRRQSPNTNCRRPRSSRFSRTRAEPSCEASPQRRWSR
ncbi:hypothetical protein ACVWZZ_006701 [Bradyrhizobium sp. LM6.10]